MGITEAVKKRFEELCYKRDINFCKLASLSGYSLYPIQP